MTIRPSEFNSTETDQSTQPDRTRGLMHLTGAAMGVIVSIVIFSIDEYRELLSPIQWVAVPTFFASVILINLAIGIATLQSESAVSRIVLLKRLTRGLFFVASAAWAVGLIGMFIR